MRRYRPPIRVPNAWLGISIAAAAGYAAVLSAATIDKHDRFASGGYDLGIFSQAVWLLAHGHAPFSTIRGRNLFADHFEPGLALLAPLGRLGLPEALLVLQATVLAAVAPVLYLLAHRRGARQPLALAVALLWLASPLTQWPNLFDYHPETTVPLLIVLGALLLERDQVVLFLVTAVLASSFKEDVPLVYLMWGLVLAFGGRRRLGLGLAAGAAAWTVLAFAVAIPAAGGSLAFYSKRFAGDRGSSVGDVFHGLLVHPIAGIETASTTANAKILIALVVCSGGLAFLAPRFLLLALPGVAADILSAYSYQHDLHFQYQLIPAACFAVASAYGAGVLSERRSTRVTTWVSAVLIGGAALVTIVASPALKELRKPEPPGAAARRQALALIPSGSSVAAAPDLAAHVALRRNVYQLPEPFIRVAGNGEYWSSAELRRRAASVTYVIDDDAHLDPGAAALTARMRRVLPRLGFRRVFARDGVRLWTR